MRRLAIALALVVCIVCPWTFTAAEAASWDAFQYAHFHAIDVVSSPQIDGSVIYGLSFVPTATIEVDNHTCQINWIQGFYLRAHDRDDRFSATDTGTNEWKWEQKPPTEISSNLAGWHGTGGNRIYADQPSRMFTFASLDTQGVPFSIGYHIGYTLDGEERSGFFYGTVAPEPSTLHAGLIMLAGLGGLVRRGRKRS